MDNLYNSNTIILFHAIYQYNKYMTMNKYYIEFEEKGKIILFLFLFFF